MQEEIENKTLTLGINSAKFTGNVLKTAISKYLAYRKERKREAIRDSPEVKPFGKVSIAELQQEYGDMRQLDLQDKGLRDFDRIARDHGVRYTVFETGKGHYQVFFKAPNEANMNAAFQKFAALKLKKAERRQSALGALEKFKALVKNAVVDRTKRKELER